MVGCYALESILYWKTSNSFFSIFMKEKKKKGHSHFQTLINYNSGPKWHIKIIFSPLKGLFKTFPTMHITLYLQNLQLDSFCGVATHLPSYLQSQTKLFKRLYLLPILTLWTWILLKDWLQHTTEEQVLVAFDQTSVKCTEMGVLVVDTVEGCWI